LMKRPCDLVGLREALIEMKKKNQGLRLATRVMIGFPTETAEDFQATIDYMRESPFEEIDVHHYHETIKTDSAKLYPKVDHRVIRERAERLEEELAEKIQINSDPS
jgi:tRNA A37 methylthiotransferase MiaB